MIFPLKTVMRNFCSITQSVLFFQKFYKIFQAKITALVMKTKMVTYWKIKKSLNEIERFPHEVGIKFN